MSADANITVAGWTFHSNQTLAHREGRKLEIVREADSISLQVTDASGSAYTISPHVIVELLCRIPKSYAEGFTRIIFARPDAEIVLTEGVSSLFDVWQLIDPMSRGITSKEFINRISGAMNKNDAIAIAARKVVRLLVGGPTLSAQLFGQRLRMLRKRVIDGRYLDYERQYNRYALWKVYTVTGE